MRIVSVFLILLVVGCNGGRGRASAFPTQLEVAVKSGATSFDFAADSTFEWDRMHVFGCYSTDEIVEQELGFEWPNYSKTSIASSDSVVLVVFVHNGTVAGWYEQPRSIELGGLANGVGYSRSEARFAIDRSKEGIELRVPTSVGEQP